MLGQIVIDWFLVPVQFAVIVPVEVVLLAVLTVSVPKLMPVLEKEQTWAEAGAAMKSKAQIAAVVFKRISKAQ